MRGFLAACAAIGACLLIAAGARAQYSYSTIALTGQNAPGLAGVSFGSFQKASVITAAGQVGFHSLLNGEGVDSTNNGSYWSWQNGALTLLARSGDAAPGTGGLLYDLSPEIPFIAGTDRFGFRGGLQGIGGNQAFWAGSTTAVSLVARTGSLAPGTGTTFDAISPNSFLTMNPSGNIAFQGDLAGADYFSAKGLWSGAPGSISLVGRANSQAAGQPAGTNYFAMTFMGTTDGGFTNPGINKNGQIAFSAATWQYPDINSLKVLGYVGSPSSLSVLAAQGQQAPGTDPGTQFGDSFFMGGSLNRNNNVAFAASLQGAGVTADNNTGMWVGTPGNLTLVARAGALAPGAGGAAFAQLQPGPLDPFSGQPVAYFDPPLNGQGAVTFTARLKGASVTADNDLGLWTGKPGQLRLLARTGDAAPDAPADTTLKDLQLPSINNAGQVLFAAELAGTTVDTSNNRALFVTDFSGALRMLLRRGQNFTVGANDVRTIDGIVTLGNQNGEDGAPTNLSDSGKVSITLSFTDGTSGIFTVQTLLPGDANGDLTVNFPDLVAVAQNYNSTGTTWQTGDFNGDGVTNFPDLVAIAQNYNRTISPDGPSAADAAMFAADLASIVPEPTAGLGCCLGAMFLFGRRARRR